VEKRVVVLDCIRSLHNVGAVFRTADAAGFSGLHLCGYTGTPPDRRIEKVSLGAEEWIEWQHWESTKECLEYLKSEGFTVVALEQSNESVDIFTHDFSPYNRVALVLGNEVEGVSDDILQLVDIIAEIPMHGQKQSLNVSVAAGIAMYQLNQ